MQMQLNFMPIFIVSIFEIWLLLSLFLFLSLSLRLILFPMTEHWLENNLNIRFIKPGSNWIHTKQFSRVCLPRMPKNVTFEDEENEGKTTDERTKKRRNNTKDSVFCVCVCVCVWVFESKQLYCWFGRMILFPWRMFMKIREAMKYKIYEQHTDRTNKMHKMQFRIVIIWGFSMVHTHNMESK